MVFGPLGGGDHDEDGSARGDNGQYPQWQASTTTTIITTVSSLQLPSSPLSPPQGPGVHLTHLSRRSPGHPLPKVLPCGADDVDVLMNSSFLDRFWIWGQIVQLESVS